MAARLPVITGVGIVTAAGVGVDAVWQAVAAGRSGLRPLTLFPSPRYGQELSGGIDIDLDGLGVPRRGSRSDRLAWLATQQAMAMSGPKLVTDPVRAGMVLGCSVGGSYGSEEFLTGLIKHGRMHPRPTRYHECSAAVELVANDFGLFGPSLTIATACSSGALAIATAAEMILSGEADVMVAGGADSLSRMTWGGFHALLLVDSEGCRPFDVGRAGMTLGEGAAMLVIESEERARRRGATILARLSGWGASCDAYHATAPQPEGTGALSAMHSALARAGLQPSDIGYVNAHGTGTRDNDLAESRALRRCFGDTPPPFSSIKRVFGHTLAASGAIEAVVCLEALRRQQLPPNPGFNEVDPAIGMEPVTSCCEARVSHIMSNSFGFGGNNAVLILSSPDQSPPTRPPQHGGVKVTGVGAVVPERTEWREIEAPLPAGRVLSHACDLSAETAKLTPNQRRRLSRMAQMALVAARRARTGDAGGRQAVAIGTGLGCLAEGAEFIESHIGKDEQEPMPARFPGSVHNAPASQVAIDFQAHGLNAAPTSGEISFEAAVWQAANQLVAGEVDVAFAGAVDELNKYPLAIGQRWGLWNERTRPGEGAVVVQLSRDAGADALARLTGVRLGRYRRPFDVAAEVDWIVSGLDLASIDVMITGAGGWPTLDPHYRGVVEALATRAGRPIEHRTYKQQCGEFHSASGIGFSIALELVRERRCGVLLYTLSLRGEKALCCLQP